MPVGHSERMDLPSLGQRDVVLARTTVANMLRTDHLVTASEYEAL